MLEIRPAHPFDASALAALLNPIIAEGSTTALTTPIDINDMRTWMERAPGRSSWLVAEKAGVLHGFQVIEPWEQLPPEACDIGSFVATGHTGLGVGSKLFEETKRIARALGYAWINAHIRADNTSGLTYYQSRGFRDWKYVKDVQLADGRIVDKIWKRFDLD